MISLAIRMATSFNLPNQAPNFLQFAPAFGSIDDDIYIIIINIYIYIIYIYIIVAPSRYTAVSIGWGWGRTMEITWPNMPW
jgi:hypothetical protein